MPLSSRRDFNRQLLGSLATYGLIETLFERNLLTDAVRPVIHQWLTDLSELCQDAKNRKIKDVEWQAKLEELYKKVDLAELVKLVDLERVARDVKFPERGA